MTSARSLRAYRSHAFGSSESLGGSINDLPFVHDRLVEAIRILSLLVQLRWRRYDHIKRNTVAPYMLVDARCRLSPMRTFRNDDQQVYVALFACFPARRRAKKHNPKGLYQRHNLTHDVAD